MKTQSAASEQESEEAPDLRIRADDDGAGRSAVHDDVLEGGVKVLLPFGIGLEDGHLK